MQQEPHCPSTDASSHPDPPLAHAREGSCPRRSSYDRRDRGRRNLRPQRQGLSCFAPLPMPPPRPAARRRPSPCPPPTTPPPAMPVHLQGAAGNVTAARLHSVVAATRLTLRLSTASRSSCALSQE
ncbi:myb-related transcription factor, partner of profilin-like [Triticum urartu]|uniref:myb-related transcription factor, partner of profilin-like n=1 Tax=Triticum urartu TaxID=4572 RepID=UPI002043BF72|nr:myb-related transcription factor, partner of profilin-like [Triticum urartu]XP_048567858.1 myb-related transcription factor, partner of profilin-like [Triticum urartu]